jgi:hypothetical protein
MAAKVSVDSDTWWHLRAGQWIIENRAVPQIDPFSYTRLGQSWQYPGWLVEAPMAWLYRALGPGGLNLWTACMVTLTFVFVWKTLHGGVFLRAFVVVLAAATSAVYWAARPYLVTFLLAAVFFWILEGYRWRQNDPEPESHGRLERRLWWLPVLMVVWVNSHGGFAVGFILWGVYWFDEIFHWAFRAFSVQRSAVNKNTADNGRQTTDDNAGQRLQPAAHNPLSPVYRLTLVGLLMVAAVCLNPSGPVMLAYPFKTVSIGALQEYIQEWQSPDFHVRAAQPFIWLLILTFAAVGASRRRLALTDFLMVAGFTYLSLLAWRNVAQFAVVVPATLTRHAAPLLAVVGRRMGFYGASVARPRGLRSVLNWGVLLLVVLAVLVKAGADFPAQVNREAFRKTMPVDAADYLQAHDLPGRLFNSYNWGGYLLWQLPQYPVFIDGRTDLYNDEVIDQWLQVMRGEPGWQDILDRWDVNLVLVEPPTPLAGQLSAAGWQQVYADDMAVLYARQGR